MSDNGEFHLQGYIFLTISSLCRCGKKTILRKVTNWPKRNFYVEVYVCTKDLKRLNTAFWSPTFWKKTYPGGGRGMKRPWRRISTMAKILFKFQILLYYEIDVPKCGHYWLRYAHLTILLLWNSQSYFVRGRLQR